MGEVRDKGRVNTCEGKREGKGTYERKESEGKRTMRRERVRGSRWKKGKRSMRKERVRGDT